MSDTFRGMRKPHSNYYRRNCSGSYSRKAAKQKKRLDDRRDKLKREIGDNTRKNIWSNYPYSLLIQDMAEELETTFEANGGFADRVDMQKFLSVSFEYSGNGDGTKRTSITFPFKYVKRGLSDEAFSKIRRLPQPNGAEIPIMQPRGYRYAGTIPAAEKERFLDELSEESMEVIKTAKAPETTSAFPRINVYVERDFTEVKKYIQKVVNRVNEEYGWFGKRLDDLIPQIGEREKGILLKELQPTLTKYQKEILHKVTHPKIENLVY